MPTPHRISSTPTELLSRLIAQPSVNPMGASVAGDIYLEHRLTDWLADYFARLGVEHERRTVAPGRDNLLARWRAPGSGGMTLLLDAHQDTVPVEGMTVPPFTPRIAAGRITGRGSADVKGGMAAILYAFQRLVHERPEGAADVVVSCTVDEEAGATGVADLVRCWQNGNGGLLTRPPVAAIVAEPTELDVIVAHRGTLRFRVLTEGTACHSSMPERGVNAIYRMARVVSCLEAYAGGLSRQRRQHPLCGGASLSVGRIGGGSSVNVVPDGCWIEVDRRLVPGERSQEALLELRHALTAGLDVPFDIEAPWLDGPALSDDQNELLSTALLATIAGVAGKRARIGVPFGTHAGPIAAAGVPAVVFGPGSIAQAHTKDEYLEIQQLDQAAEILYQFCRNSLTCLTAMQGQAQEG